MITMMIVMDCLHFANYFVPLIYNGELSQSALKGRRRLIAFAKSMAGVFFCFVLFFFPSIIPRNHKRLDSLHQLGHIPLKTNRAMSVEGINRVMPHCTGNRREHGRAVGSERVSAPTGWTGEPSLKPFLSACRRPRRPFLKANIQNVINYHMNAIITPPA